LQIATLAESEKDISSLLEVLLLYKWDDGSFGGYQKRVFDTTLALRALQAANYSDNQLIENAVLYLLSQQNSDGGWGLGTSGSWQEADSSIYLTSLVLLVLEEYRETYNLHSQLGDGAVWLSSQQNQDGGFGKPGSSIWETALSYSALIGQQSMIHSPQTLTKALSYIEGNQEEDGSWNQNAYETALALRALKGLSARPCNLIR
jgi:squalene cyclase